MQYLVIENFRGRDPVPVYRRFRDRGRLEGEIRALTAQQRASVWLVTALAPIGLLFINFINPEWGALLFGTTLGRIVLGIALVLEIVGYVFARQASVVEV